MNTRISSLLLSLFLSAFVWTTAPVSAQVTWDGGGDGTSWSDPLNWSTDAVPTDLDDVAITTNVTINLDIPAATNAFTLERATLEGAEDLTIGGLFTWASGTLRGTGTVTANGGAAFTDANARTLIGRTLDLAASADWTNGDFALGDGAVLNVEAGQTLTADLATTRRIFRSGSITTEPVFNVLGTLTLPGTTALLSLDVTTNIAGTMDMADGALADFGFASTLTGSIFMAGAAQVEFDGGTHDIAGQLGGFGGVLGGQQALDGLGEVLIRAAATANFNAGALLGANLFNNGGSAIFNTAMSLLGYQSNGGTLGVNATLTIDGQLVFTGNASTLAGDVDGNGVINAQDLTIFEAGFGQTLDNITLNLNGNASWTEGDIVMRSGSKIFVLLGNEFTIDLTKNARIFRSGVIDTEPLFDVDGNLIINTPGNEVSIDAPFDLDTNSIINIQNGTLRIGGESTIRGTINVDAGNSLEFDSGTHTFGDGIVNGGGSMTVRNSTLSGNGTFNTQSDFINSLFEVDQQFTWNAPVEFAEGNNTIQGQGSEVSTFTMTADATFTSGFTYVVNGVTLNLDGGATWEDGNFVMQDNSQVQLPEGQTLTINLDGNQQMFRSGVITQEPRFDADGMLIYDGSNGEASFDLITTVSETSEVTLLAGELNFGGGGSSGGLWNASANTIIDIDGGVFDFNNGATVQGDGTFGVSRTGTANFNVGSNLTTDVSVDADLNLITDQTVRSFTQSGGTTSLDNATLTVTGPSRFTGDNLTLNGTGDEFFIFVDEVIFDGGFTYFINNVYLTLDGGGIWNNGNFAMQDGGGISVPLGDEFLIDLETNRQMFRSGLIFNDPVFDLFGNLISDTPGGDASIDITVNVADDGQIDMQDGRINFGFESTSAGLIQTGTGTTFAYDTGTHTNNGTHAGTGTLLVGTNTNYTDRGITSPGGDAIGTLFYDGTYEPTSDARITFVLGDESDTYAIDGDAFLNGTLEITLVDDTLVDGEETVIITTTGTIDGDWDDVQVNTNGNEDATVTIGDNTVTVTITIPDQGSISGVKFDDQNNNGLFDEGEPGLPGWTIELERDGAFVGSTVTGANGTYSFSELPDGVYRVTEVQQNGWVQTFPQGDGSHTVNLVDGAMLDGLHFGNRLIQADLAVTKEADRTEAVIGDTLTYTVTITNNGPDTATSPILTDVLPVDSLKVVTLPDGFDCFDNEKSNQLTCDLDPLAAGAALTLSYQAVALQPGTLVNSARIENVDEPDLNTSNNTATAPVEVRERRADLGITKEALENVVAAGDTLAYVVTITNNGPEAASAPVFTDTLPSNSFVFADLPIGPDCSTNEARTTLTCRLDPLAAGATLTLTYGVWTLATGTLVNNASIINEGGETDLNVENNSASVTVEVRERMSDLAVTKEADRVEAIVGDTLTYTVTITNNGPDASFLPRFSDVLSADSLTFVTVPENLGCQANATGNELTCDFARLATGAILTFSYRAVALKAGTLINRASIDNLDGADPNTSNNTDAVPVDVRARMADLAISKEALETEAVIGDTLAYVVTITNNGPDTASAPLFTDILPADSLAFITLPFGFDCATSEADTVLTCSLDPIPAGTLVTLTYTALALKDGTLVNNASVLNVGDEIDPNEDNNDANAPVEVRRTADLSVSKEADRGEVALGDTLTYTVTISNNGPGTAEQIVFLDFPEADRLAIVEAPGDPDLTCFITDGNLDCSLASLAAGSTRTFSYRAVAMALGTVQNAAEVSMDGDVQDPNPANNRTSVAVEVRPRSVDLLVIKEVDRTEAVVGDTLTYTVTLANNGPDTASNPLFVDQPQAGLTIVEGPPDDANRSCTVQDGTLECLFNSFAAGGLVSFSYRAVATDTGTVRNVATVSPNTAEEEDPNPANNTTSVDVEVRAPMADLRVNKEADRTQVVVGDTLTYTVTVFNLGPEAAQDVVFEDTPQDGLQLISTPFGLDCVITDDNLKCQPFPLDEETLLTISYQAIATTTGMLENTAMATSATEDPVPANNSSSVTVEVLSESDLSIEKVTPGFTAVVGDTLTYTLTITNSGPAADTGVIINDQPDAGLTIIDLPSVPNVNCLLTDGALKCFVDVLEVGQTIVLPYRVIATTVGSLTNTATVQSTSSEDRNETNNTAVATITAEERVADLAVIKEADRTEAVVGDTLTYTVTISNNGPDTAYALRFDDAPQTSGLTLLDVPSDPALDCFIADNRLICRTAELASGGTLLLSYRAVATAIGTQTNSATINSEYVFGSEDPNPGNNTASVEVEVRERSADLAITKEALQTEAVVGDTLTYIVTIANSGPDTASDPAFIDFLPADALAFVTLPEGLDCSVEEADTTLRCDLDPLAAGATLTLTYQAVALETGTLVNNAAVVSFGEPDPNVDNNTASAPVEVRERSADLAITKEALQTEAVVGDTLTYVVTIANSGPDTASDPAFIDFLPADALAFVTLPEGLDCSVEEADTILRCDLDPLAAGATLTLTYQAVALEAGTLVNNAAVVSFGEPDPNVDNNTASAPVEVRERSADLAITKEALQPLVAVGDTITYVVTVANNGPDRATGIGFEDRVPKDSLEVITLPDGLIDCMFNGQGGLACGIEPLEPGTTTTFTYQAVALAAGTVINTAVAAAAEDDPVLANNTAQAPVEVRPSRIDLAITKTATPMVALGDTITYAVTVTNVGLAPSGDALMQDTIHKDSVQVIGSSLPSGCVFGFILDNVEIDCTLNSLAVGESVTFSFQARALAAGIITNRAEIADPSDLNDANDRAEATTAVAATLATLRGTKFNDRNANSQRDDGEEGLAGWTITVQDDARNVIASTVTDSVGAYLLFVPPGTYGLTEIEQDGWTPTFPLDADNGIDTGAYPALTVAAGDIRDGLDFGNSQAVGAIIGFKYHDVNGNGERDSGDGGLADWGIELLDAEGTLLKRHTTVDDPLTPGQYAFAALPPGTYRVREVPQAGWAQTFPVGPFYTVTVEAGQFTNGIDFLNSQAVAAITGLKFHDVDGNSQRDDGDDPLGGWEITATGETSALAITEDGTGRYRLLVPPGTYRISEIAQNGWTPTFPLDAENGINTGAYPDVTVAAGAMLDGLDFGNSQAVGAITGLKFNDRDGNGVRDDGDEGLADWTIELLQDGEVLARHTTVDDPFSPGQYAFAALQPGTYTVREVQQDGWMQTFPSGDGTHTVVVEGGQFASDINFGNRRTMADLSISKEALQPEVAVGDTITYVVTIANSGPDASFNVLFADTPDPGDLRIISTPANLDCTLDPGGFECTVAALAAGEALTYTYQAVALRVGTAENLAQITADEEDPNLDNNRSVAPVEVGPGPATLTGFKFNDLNQNGKWDRDTEPGLPGWTISAAEDNEGIVASTVTAADGSYTLMVPAGTYSIVEDLQPGWRQTLPGKDENFSYNVIVENGDTVTDLLFGNFRVTTDLQAKVSAAKVDSMKMALGDPLTVDQGDRVRLDAALINEDSPIGPDDMVLTVFSVIVPTALTIDFGTVLPPFPGLEIEIDSSRVDEGLIAVNYLFETVGLGDSPVTFQVLATTPGTHTVRAEVTSEALDPNPANNTDNVAVTVDPTGSIDVTTTADSGPGSLRDALEKINAGLFAIIEFALGDGSQIDVLSPLPRAERPVTIRRKPAAPLRSATSVVLNGSTCPAPCDGLTLAAQGSSIDGMLVQGFPGYGLVLDGDGGHMVLGSGFAANTAGGVLIAGGDGNTLGSPEAPNGITDNGGNGITVRSGTGHAFAANTFAGNLGLGIDLGEDGVTDNDGDDTDAGPNSLQNYPVLTAFDANARAVTGTLNSTPLANFALTFYGAATCDASGFGEGEQILGTAAITTDANGDAAFTVPLTAEADFLTATATGTDGTSEFAACFATQPAVSLTITPDDLPVVIPPEGGNVGFTTTLVNNTDMAQTVDFWAQILGPNIDRQRAPRRVTLDPSEVRQYKGRLRIPRRAPAGSYTFTAFIGTFPDADASSGFGFEKLEGAAKGAGGEADWSIDLDVDTADATLPEVFALAQNYPNPFNPQTTIRYALPEAATVRLIVYDLLGREVIRLADGPQQAGFHEAVFDASRLAAGVYLYVLHAEGFTASRQMVLLK